MVSVWQEKKESNMERPYFSDQLATAERVFRSWDYLQMKRMF